jgi:diguanylate cyclase (GGDEF)-like protein
MNELFKTVRYIPDKLKKIRFSNLIASVPHELEAQFDRRQLKNSLFRIRNLAIAIISFRLITIIVYSISGGRIIYSGRLAQLIYGGQKIFYHINSYNFAAIILFFLLIVYFKKKGKRSMLWLICYLFIMFDFVSVVLSMMFTELESQILYLFSTSIFLNVFIPDFKPKIFILSAVLFYLTVTGIIVYRYSFFEIGDTLLFISETFVAILIVKLLHYNNNVKVFIDISRINALNEKLAALSKTDELTKLDNRRSFLDYMDIIWKQSCRLRLPLSVLMLDVAHFKKYNDSMGHLEGDKVLFAIAQCLKNNLKRDTDFVARFGGEEFVCLLPYIKKGDALNFAKEIVQSVENMRIRHPLSKCSNYVTISAGMASIMPDENKSQTQLLDGADKALYTAKSSGRNRVVTN